MQHAARMQDGPLEWKTLDNGDLQLVNRFGTELVRVYAAVCDGPYIDSAVVREMTSWVSGKRASERTSFVGMIDTWNPVGDAAHKWYRDIRPEHLARVAICVGPGGRVYAVCADGYWHYEPKIGSTFEDWPPTLRIND